MDRNSDSNSDSVIALGDSDSDSFFSRNSFSENSPAKHKKLKVTHEEHFLNNVEGISSEKDDNSEEDDIINAFIPDAPYHINLTSLKSFYTDIQISYPSENFDFQHGDNRLTQDKVTYNNLSINRLDYSWNVSLGDIVAIHLSEESRAPQSVLTYYPFKVNWGIGEVTSIFRVMKTRAEAMSYISDNTEKSQSTYLFENVMIEVRWFNRKRDLPGSGPSSLSTIATSNQDNEIEEIFESDSCDDVSFKALLSPVQLKNSKETSPFVTSNDLGMPVLQFCCYRLWSIYRDSLIPIGSAENRFERGMFYSKYLKKGSVAREELEKLKGFKTKHSDLISFAKKEDWRKKFYNAIERLTLSDASDHMQLHSNAIVGREKELEQIATFLRSAIRGTDMKSTNSLFIAGPREFFFCFFIFLISFIFMNFFLN